MKKYHLIAGLPRSGSTLLSAILNQNPKFHASVTSPLQHYVDDVIRGTYYDFGYKALINDEKMKKIIEGLFNSYHYDIDKEICFNTGRTWVTLFNQISHIFPNTKIICTVRDVVEVVNSFELLYLKNPLNVSTIYGPYRDDKGGHSPSFHHQNVYTRTIHISNLIESCLMGLRELYFGPNKKSMFLIEYNDLCKSPSETMNKLYDFLEQPKFDHNFNQIESNFDEYDIALNANNMHKVRQKIELNKKDLILPDDIIARFRNKEFWRKTRFT